MGLKGKRRFKTLQWLVGYGVRFAVTAAGRHFMVWQPWQPRRTWQQEKGGTTTSTRLGLD